MPTPGESAIKAIKDKGIIKPILVLGGRLGDGKMNRLRLLDVRALMLKPYDIDAFLSKVKELLQ